MRILWVVLGAVCGVLSLLLRMLGSDYGNMVTGLFSWALFACLMVLVTRRTRRLPQFIGGSAVVGTLVMVLGMLPLQVILILPGGETISGTTEFAYLSRAFGGALAGLALFYLWRASEPIRQSAR